VARFVGLVNSSNSISYDQLVLPPEKAQQILEQQKKKKFEQPSLFFRTQDYSLKRL